ncbi:aspartyl protease family protein At5g10770-like [Miscanthus floridulus]|uniref:aspartyl protease family protein At5g10770-like n=1 Tax=Miscanthus floridulus TaxID=154761 RepID=UPI00345AC6EA
MAAYWILHLALLLLSITSQQVLAARPQDRHTISVQSLLSSSMCSSASAAPAGSTLQIVRRACLQTGDHEIVPDHHDTTAILHRDRHRVQSIHRRLTGAETTATSIPARLGLAFQSLEYVVTIGIGTPARNFTVLFDTGSDLTWVQCLPCPDSSCYHQEEPLFDPSKSSTYVNISCSAPECHIGGAQQTSCGGTSCQYSVKYGDQSVTRGSLAEETFTLSPLAPPATGVVFGCSHEYISGFNDRDMGVAGLLGLGRGDSSILSQARQGNSGGGVFSYCLPPRGSSTGYLTIGAAAPQQSNLSFTPLITTISQLSFAYVVNLAGISVNGAAVPIPASAFSLGAIIDSGTVATHMPAAAYYPLRDEFRRHMGGYKMLPEGSVEFLDTCYDVMGQNVVTAPRVALEFGGGARIDVDASGILFVFPVADDSGPSLMLACLAFVPTNSPGLVIVGNMQQRAYNVVFDVDGGRIGFGPNGCS